MPTSSNTYGQKKEEGIIDQVEYRGRIECLTSDYRYRRNNNSGSMIYSTRKEERLKKTAKKVKEPQLPRHDTSNAISIKRKRKSYFTWP